MSRIPIVPHHAPSATMRERRHVQRLASDLSVEQPSLAISESMKHLVPDSLEDAPALHLDDLSDISLIDRFHDVSFMEDRARFRAGAGDYVASCAPRTAAFETYCEEQLGLGSVRWLHPRPRVDPLRVAAACWTDRDTRHELVRAIRTGDLRYLHPHIGSPPVWATALLLQQAARRPVKVIAPPPVLARRVNNKIWFTTVARRLFGRHAVPPTADAWNFATLAHVVSQLARGAREIVIKIPSSAGGSGNLVLQAEGLAGKSKGALRRMLKERLRDLRVRGPERFLVGAWEEDVISAPSVQLWIPPPGHGEPVIEGLYEQMISGTSGFFKGSRPAHYPEKTTATVTTEGWLLALLFQKLGYIGRCSFDAILVGKSLEECRVEFIECNGRWGGTSLPMTLMNRLFGDCRLRCHGTMECEIDGLERVRFTDVLRFFDRDLFDARNGRGNLVFYNPGGLSLRGGIDVLAISASRDDVTDWLTRKVPESLTRLVSELETNDPRGGATTT